MKKLFFMASMMIWLSQPIVYGYNSSDFVTKRVQYCKSESDSGSDEIVYEFRMEMSVSKEQKKLQAEKEVREKICEEIKAILAKLIHDTSYHKIIAISTNIDCKEKKAVVDRKNSEEGIFSVEIVGKKICMLYDGQTIGEGLSIEPLVAQITVGVMNNIVENIEIKKIEIFCRSQ